MILHTDIGTKVIISQHHGSRKTLLTTVHAGITTEAAAIELSKAEVLDSSLVCEIYQTFGAGGDWYVQWELQHNEGAQI